ncbi:DoxX family protein [Roseibium sp.]|uniref:DoxX family protein n=1 Tax=Roseibium sp. TaxID=1936156 RepID=UPI003263AAFE
MTLLKPFTPYLLSALRIASGLLFLQHGATKYLSLPKTGMSGVDPMTLGGAAGLIELVCGALVVVGLFTRPAAFLASGTMAAAYFLVHAPQSLYPIINGGELAALYSFVFVYLAAAGGGPISIDRMVGRG